MKRLLVLDGNAKGQEVFCTLILVGARLADDLVGKLSSEMVLDCLFLRGALDCSLEAVQEHGQVFLYVHLLNHIHWLALPVFEGMTVCFRVDVHLLREEQACEQRLPLQEHVVFIRVLVMVGVLDGKNIVAEARDHKQLLIKRVHIADAAQVLDSNAASTGLFVIVEFDVPVALLVSAPRGALVELLHVSHHLGKVLETVAREDQQQEIGCFSRMVAFALGCILTAMWNLKQTVVHQVPGELLTDDLFAFREALQQLGQDTEVAP